MTLWGIIKGLLVQEETDRTKQVSLEVDASATTATRTTLSAAQTADRTVTLPDATDTIVARATSDTLTNKDLKAATNLLTGASADSLVRETGNQNIVNIPDAVATDDIVLEDHTQTLTNKSVDGDNNTLSNVDIASLKVDLPDAANFLTRDGIGNVISTAKATPSGDVVGTSDSQVLTTKSIDADNNTITNIDDADIKAAAGIDATKIGNGDVTDAELSFINSVSSNVQDQIDSKTTIAGLTDDRLLRADGATGVQDSGITVNDSNNVSGVVDLTMTGLLALNNVSSGGTIANAQQQINTNVSGISTNAGNIPADSDGLAEGVSNLYNQTHTGEVTGSVALAIDSTAISNQTPVAAASTDTILIGDASDSNNLKSVTAQSIADLGSGSSSNSIVLKALTNADTPYSPLSTEEFFACDTSSGIVQVDLPVASTNDERVIRIKKTTGDLTGCAINPDGSDTIDDNASTTLDTIGEIITLVADGPNNNWVTIHRVIPSKWTSYTPTFTGLGTPTLVSFFWRRVGEEIEVRGSFNQGTSTAATATIGLPGSLAIDTALLATEKRDTLGSFYSQITTSATAIPATTRGLFHVAFRASDANSVFLTWILDQSADSANSLWDEQNATGRLITSGAGVTIKFTVPINGWNS